MFACAEPRQAEHPAGIVMNSLLRISKFIVAGQQKSGRSYENPSVTRSPHGEIRILSGR
jgi:hypothetical protein